MSVSRVTSQNDFQPYSFDKSVSFVQSDTSALFCSSSDFFGWCDRNYLWLSFMARPACAVLVTCTKTAWFVTYLLANRCFPGDVAFFMFFSDTELHQWVVHANVRTTGILNYHIGYFYVLFTTVRDLDGCSFCDMIAVSVSDYSNRVRSVRSLPPPFGCSWFFGIVDNWTIPSRRCGSEYRGRKLKVFLKACLLPSVTTIKRERFDHQVWKTKTLQQSMFVKI